MTRRIRVTLNLHLCPPLLVHMCRSVLCSLLDSTVENRRDIRHRHRHQVRKCKECEDLMQCHGKMLFLLSNRISPSIETCISDHLSQQTNNGRVVSLNNLSSNDSGASCYITPQTFVSISTKRFVLLEMQGGGGDHVNQYCLVNSQSAHHCVLSNTRSAAY